MKSSRPYETLCKRIKLPESGLSEPSAAGKDETQWHFSE
jgi:hypothetical protein